MNKVSKAFSVRLGKYINRFGFGNNKIKGLSLIHRLRALTIIGENNTITINSKLSKDVRIVVYGSNHNLTIENNVNFKNGLLWFEDYGCTIYIAQKTTIESAVLSVAENGTSIRIGEDCMLSKDIRIATSDAHSVIDAESGKRINPAADIIMENHVWLGNSAFINKGCTIGHDSIIAGRSVVTHSVEPNTIAAGVPAKVVKTGVIWDRKRINV